MAIRRATVWLAVVNVLLACSGALADTANGAAFPDVPSEHWACEAVEGLSTAGVLEGLPDGSFQGRRAATRYEFARILQRLAADAALPVLPADGERPAAQPFADVPESHWARSAVEYARDAGLVAGYPDRTFRGQRPASRFEVLMGLWRVAQRLELRPVSGDSRAPDDVFVVVADSPPPINPQGVLIPEVFDGFPPDHWVYEAVEGLARLGVLPGYPHQPFHGKRPMTRYECVQMVYRFRGILPMP